MSKQKRRKGISTVIILIVVALAVVGVAAVFVSASAAGATRIAASDLFEVKRGGFDITVPASGELVALRQEEIRNELEVDAVITEIVDEGTFAQEGDVLLRLNDEELIEEIRDEQDEVNESRNDLASAEANLAITISESNSELANADLEIQLAELSLKAWEEGEDVSKRQDLQLNLETNKKEFIRAVANFEAAGSLVEKGFISVDEYRSREISKMAAEAALKKAELDIQVYENYEYERDKAELDSALAQARDAKGRIELKTASELESAESEVESRKFGLKNDEERLAKLQRQLDACIVKAPTAGLVVYASSLESQGHRGGNNDDVPQVGSELRRNELVMILPDTSRMVAEVKVNEALSGQIKAGQRATIVSDAVRDAVFQGTVQSVGVLAQSGGWRDPNRRDYTVKILIDGENERGLKPSMRCAADIKVGRVADAVYVPVEAIHHSGSITFAYVARGGGFQALPVTIGEASETYISITDGLNEGDMVLLRKPQPNEMVGRVPADDSTETTTKLEDVLHSPAPKIEAPAPVDPKFNSQGRGDRPEGGRRGGGRGRGGDSGGNDDNEGGGDRTGGGRTRGGGGDRGGND